MARLIQRVLPGMRENHCGRIINISSMGGKIWTRFGGWYHATKFAVEGFSDCLRMEVAPFGIDVVVVEPGGINSGNMLTEPEIVARTVKKAIVKRRPRTRYLIGFMAKPMVLIQKIFGARVFDWVITNLS